ncbi:hypothetical protein SAMN02982989_3227 [Xaviernesmea oryzae]|uniref:HD/PDEase domain-containing protein n=1 Tax=Xaviernesmea oryzae TaxID=464029 RepID=A0A1X7DZA6_9HYPH|nr:HD domain-containing protein [Xaviernesmea oryzae]SMF24362.1 hypothetical protein SAMN02982989_3227 [Xaviernesmea oryzae]
MTNSLGLDAPLLTDVAPAGGTLRSDESFLFDDPFVAELCQTRPLRRLQRIGFLGAIDYVKTGTGRSPHRRRHNRYEHSLGVAKLAETYSEHRELKLSDRRLIIAAALLHDVGHGPLSHTLEPVFEAEFGINHHQMGHSIIRGETKLGDGIGRTLRAYSVDPEEVIALIDGKHDGPLNFLFSSQINLDTVEGITRCRAFFGRRTAFGSARALTARLCRSNHLPTSSLDEFWELKHSVYNLFITANVGLVLDSVAQAYMRDNISRFTADDFLTTEDNLRSRHGYIFKIFHMVTARAVELRRELSRTWLDTELPVKKRRFFVDENEPLSGVDAINRRYRQSKTTFSIRLGEILE